jgi:pimeloyl-ACP methyl ester carboxylesterase
MVTDITVARYWDPEIHTEQYSYVDAAVAQGYSILTYDRLGTGDSDKPNAYDVVQVNTQIEILKELTNLARTGQLVKSSKAPNACSKALSAYKAKKVVHIGHSFGSITTAGMLTSYGEISDGAILTGFLYNNETFPNLYETFGLEFARESDPIRFADRSSGYLVQRTPSNIQQIFLKKGSFEPEILQYSEQVKQPGTVGEVVSGELVLGKPAPAFKGPVQVRSLPRTRRKLPRDLWIAFD